MYSRINAELNGLIDQLPAGKEGFITPSQADFLYHFIMLTRPRLVAETGFHVGHSACVIMKAMEEYGGGTLISFDIAKYEETKKAVEIVKKRFENLHFVEGDTKQTLAGTLAQLFNQNPTLTLDFCIVDGGHDVETARHDMIVMESLLKPGGYLWLDDFENNIYRNVGVNVAGREFAMSRKHCLRFITDDHRGILIHQKGF